MARNNQQDKKIDFINIDCESNYFDTKEQIKLRNTRWFVETTTASKLTGSNFVMGLFSRTRAVKDDAVYNSASYTTSSAILDPSGGSRKILSLDNDYIVSGSVDSYKNGVEITQDKHWTAGLAKVTAGTPGHLLDSTLFGVSTLHIGSDDTYVEIDTFDPVAFIGQQEDQVSFSVYPIVSKDANEGDNNTTNGIIEPFPIRSVIGGTSINFPFEPHSVHGEFGSGNSGIRRTSDQVLTVDYYTPKVKDKALYLDAVDMVSLDVDGRTGLTIGPSVGYVTHLINVLQPYEDAVFPRGEAPSSTYDADMINALDAMAPGGTTYVSGKQRAGTSGFVYDNAPSGTDSIAFGGLAY
jgi:hypothetical protein